MKYKIKISTMDNQPIFKARGDKLDDLKPIFKSIKQKLGGLDK